MKIIDTHAHFFPPEVLDFYRGHGGDRVAITTNTDGSMAVHYDGKVFHPTLPLPIYDVDSHLETMDAAGVDMHAISVPPPMVYWAEPAAGLELCQIANEAMTAIAGKHPDRIIPVASLPLQAPDLAVQELRRAVTDLGHRMVIVGSNVDGVELDHPSLEPIWAEAETLGAAMFVHPILGAVTGAFPADRYRLNLSLGMVTDTTIAAARFVCSGVVDRHPDLKVSFAHLGGLLPFVGDRIDYFLKNQPGAGSLAAGDFNDYIGRLWYDVVCYSDRMLDAALRWVSFDRIMMGTDSPFMGDSTPDIRAIIERSGLLTEDQQFAIYEGNPRRFLGMDPDTELEG